MNTSLLTQAPPWEGTHAARKVLVAALSTGQRFGMMHLVDVLVGAKAPTVLRHSHDELIIFGCGTEYSRKIWQSIIRQLLANGYLKPESVGFGALQCTDRALAVLRNDEKVYFRGDTNISRVPKPFTRPLPSRFDPQREQLFQALKERRSAIARANQVPDDRIFNDAILAEVVRQKPRSVLELERIPGISAVKAARFGDELLEVLCTFSGREFW